MYVIINTLGGLQWILYMNGKYIYVKGIRNSDVTEEGCTFILSIHSLEKECLFCNLDSFILHWLFYKFLQLQLMKNKTVSWVPHRYWQCGGKGRWCDNLAPYGIWTCDHSVRSPALSTCAMAQLWKYSIFSN